LSVPLVVIAAGLSTRFGRLKQLEGLAPNGEAIMDYNVFDAIRAGFDEVTYVVRPEILEDIRAHVREVFGDSVLMRFVIQDLASLPPVFKAPPERRRPWGTAHAMLCAANALDGPLVVCNADDLYGPAAFEQLHDHLTRETAPSGSSLIAYPLRDTLSGGEGVARGVCHVGRDALLEHVIEVREIRRRHHWIVGGEGEDTPVDLTGDEMVSMNLWGFTAGMVDGIRYQFKRFLDLWGTHPGREFFLSTAVNEHIQTYASPVRVLDSSESWLGITHPEDRERFQMMLGDRIEAGAYQRNLAHTVTGKA
jgi:hypothetical protein